MLTSRDLEIKKENSPLPALEPTTSTKVVYSCHKIPREHTRDTTAGMEDARAFG